MYEQLDAQARQVATALAIGIAPDAEANDLTAIEQTINTLFSSGYYQSISYSNLSGETLVSRQEGPSSANGVPDWFNELVSVPNHSAYSEVVYDGARLGEVIVVSEIHLAHQDLWRECKAYVFLYGAIAVMVYLLALRVLMNILRPLRHIQVQANAICRKNFDVLGPLPRQRELRQTVSTVNNMMSKLKQMFSDQVALIESLHQKVHLDPLTLLSNMVDFESSVDAHLSSEHGGSGGLGVIQLRDVKSLNDRLGRPTVDELIVSVADVIRQELEVLPGCIVGRRSGGEFMLLVPGLTQDLFEEKISVIFGRIQRLPLFIEDSSLRCYGGFVMIERGKDRETLCALVDHYLQKTVHKAQSGWTCESLSSSSLQAASSRSEAPSLSHSVFQAKHWRRILLDALESNSFLLHYQPVYTNRKELMHLEVFSRLKVAGEIYHAGMFVPYAERFELAESVDKAMLSKLARSYNASFPVAVNLSCQTICSDRFCLWLEEFVRDNGVFADRLIIEFNEHFVSLIPDKVERLVATAKRLGLGVSLDNFGNSGVSFHYLQTLPVDVLKVNRRFIRELSRREDYQFFLRSLVQIASSCEVTLLADGIENESEWRVLTELNLGGGQGYWLAKPEPDYDSFVKVNNNK
ncbi:hypothetical protein GCM10007877_09100 [Marinibactrum halimedae]|uniref:EAL domain-containing protein n=1 Tax=Marinibactrum halimedae TaxID=1444977 RepID=A0AA37T7I0_9GAMM|nr:hypothetical protein GCM10007877_09100 [Marinibactrum halimedae]